MDKQEYIEEIVEDARQWSNKYQQPEDKKHDEAKKTGWQSTIALFFKRLGAFVMILLLLYVYGIHQGLLFQQTPEQITVTKDQYPPADIVAASSTITVPVHVYTLVQDTSDADGVDTARLLSRTEAVWHQAKIGFETRGTTTVEANRDTIISFITDPTTSIQNIAPAQDGRINVFVTPALGGINGVAFRGLDAVAVAEYTTSFDFRVLAHEFGHIFGLGHVDVGGRLMQQGGNGDILNDSEVQSARSSAKQLTE